MNNRTNPVRRHSRFPVSWPVLYGNNSFLAEGTVLDLTALGWRVTGSMPVAPGMQLTLQVSISERSVPLRIHRATVLWVKDHEFAIEAHELTPVDQAWVTEFLQQKLGLKWMSRITNQETSLQAKGDAPHKAALPQSSVPSVDDVLHRFLVIETALSDMPVETQWNGDSDFQEGEVLTSYDYVPRKLLREASRILRGMVTIKAARQRSNQDPIASN